jgi:peptidoglycan/LPS O-acetylase OafA/YrhL
MFGSLRIFLALVVVVAHLGGFVGYSAAYAVFGFYALSGYLMARILDQTYGYTAAGFGLYLLNRFLRLYPLYWLGCLIALVMIGLSGETLATGFHRNFQLPREHADIAALILNWYLQPDNSSHLVPPSWAITVEFTFYVLIGLGLGRTRTLGLAWLAASALYHALALVLGWDRYYSIAAASLPFSIGVTLYLWRHELSVLLPRNGSMILMSAIAFGLLVVATPLAPSVDPKGWPFYFALVAAALLINSFSCWRPGPSARGIDDWLGRLSYPIYILHYQVAFAAYLAFGLPARGSWLLAAAIPLLLSLAFVIARLEQATIERGRAHLRTIARSGAYARAALRPALT